MSEPTSKAPILILAVFALVMAFLGYEMLQFRRAGKRIHGVEISLAPAQLILKPGESHGFEATVVGSENTDVGWKLQEGGTAGAVAPTGVSERDGHLFATANYIAPSSAGTYHLLAISRADPTRSATATITVQ